MKTVVDTVKSVWVWMFGRRRHRQPKTFHQDRRETWRTGSHAQRLRGQRSKRRAAKKRRERNRRARA